MKHLIIGTAGHVDHGKTALIRALTGHETDRLPEEKARGISIDIGFAEFVLPSGRRAGVVDVPGHERFIHNMLAGVTGIDLVLMVVAADEGVMPQTSEHLNILRLLGLRRGIVVVTKKDLVDAEWLEMIFEEIRTATKGGFLEEAPLVAVSSVTGEGLAELKSELDRMLEEVEPKDASAFPRLPVDRVFTSTGFGTVVTGTLVSGTLRVDQRLEVLPQALEVRVRGLQVHGRKVAAAEAGQRVAVNLAGIDRNDVRRGSVLTEPGILKPTQALAGCLVMLTEDVSPLKSGTRVHLHTGTVEVPARVVLLERDEIGPGERGYALFRLEAPTVVGRRDCYIIRSFSPLHTIGGGTVIEPHARHYRRNSAESVTDLKAKEQGTPDELVARALSALKGPTSSADLVRSTGLPVDQAGRELKKLVNGGMAIELAPDVYLHQRVADGLASEIKRFFHDYFRQFPLRWGAPREEMRRRVLPKCDLKSFNLLIARMTDDGALAVNRDRVAPAGRVISFTPAQAGFRERVLARLSEGRFSPPTVREITAGPEAAGLNAVEAMEIVAGLVEEGLLVKVSDDCVIHRENFEQARLAVINYLKKNGRLSMAEFRDLLGTTRKYAVPLLEYFDSIKITRRVGDERVLA